MGRTNKFAVAFVVLLAGGLGAYIIISRGLYPVAFVGTHPISGRTVETTYRGALRYYIVAAETYGTGLKEVADPAAQVELRRAAVDRAINTILIRAELKRRLGGELDAILEKKLSTARNDEKFRESATGLYGLDFNAYETTFLVPMAEEELLDDRLHSDNNGNVSEWLRTARAAASVWIFAPVFSWKNGGVVANGVR
ncbi:MAG: hypothetical protein HYS43_01325 [Candidatus Liptonbacteria bacterium]|nr:hypothetical protein [Candidatus Liptonbacteria bacterium]